MGILRTILFILLGYYALVLLGRLLRPWIQAYARRKAESLFREAYGNARPPEAEGPVGQVTVDKGPQQRSKTSQKVGEYIEYEEIE